MQAFRGCTNLESVKIPASVTVMEGIFNEAYFALQWQIPRSPFAGCDKVVITCPKGSFAESYAKENQISYIYEGESGNGNSSAQITPTENKLKSATITAKNVTKTYGDKVFSLGAKVNSNGKLTYSSSDKKVATVSSTGKVTLKGYGKTTITIKAEAKGEFKAAEKKIVLTVKPKNATLNSVKATASKTIMVKWKKDKMATGYIVQYSTDKNFKKNVKTVTITKSSVTSKKIAGLVKKKKYYVRVCAYKKVTGKKLTGTFSKVKSVMVQ